MNILEFLFGFPVSACNVQQGSSYILVFTGCRWEFAPYADVSGEQTLSIDCHSSILTISGLGGNSVDLSCLTYTPPECYPAPLSLIGTTIYTNFGTACESGIDIGGAIPPPVIMFDISYDDLMSTMSANSLNDGAFYRILDFSTQHFLPGTTTSYVAPVEPIITQALSNSQVSNIVRSESHPEDIIYRDPTKNSVTVGGNTISRPGRIYRRIDTINNIDIPCDFRNVMQNRYSVNIPLVAVFDLGTSYAQDDIVYVASDDAIYVSNTGSFNLGHNPGSGDGFWTLLIPDVSTAMPLTGRTGPGVSTNIPCDYINFTSVPMIQSSIVKNLTIESLSDEAEVYEIPNLVIKDSVVNGFYAQSVFCSTFDTAQVHNNTVKSNFSKNYIKGNFKDNIIDNDFVNNASYNTTGTSFGYDVNTNIFTRVQKTNIIGNFDNNRLIFVTGCVFNVGVSINTFRRFGDCITQGGHGSNTRLGTVDTCNFGIQCVSNQQYTTGILVDCNIDQTFNSNIITNLIASSNFGIAFQANVFGAAANPVRYVNFGGFVQARTFDAATHLDGSYDKDVRIGSDGVSVFCTFLDPTGNTQVENALA